MLKKVVIGALALTTLGATIAAVVYGINQKNPVGVAQAAQPAGQEVAAEQDAVAAQEAAVPQLQAAQEIGEPWTATGTITLIDDYGLSLALPDGSEVYVELGPPDYWQAQGVTLAVGDTVTVQGFTNGEQVHAAAVTTAAGQTLTLRTESGQPLWAGGAQNATGSQDSTHTGEPQVQVTEWVTVEGTITAMLRGQITLQSADGQTITFQTGQPRFFASQGITLQAGDAISVLGFYQDTAFNAGEIVVTATGQRIMLRDPNGRPLWAGGGNGGSGNGGSGNGGSGGGQ
jgi:hypothetical protein